MCAIFTPAAARPSVPLAPRSWIDEVMNVAAKTTPFSTCAALALVLALVSGCGGGGGSDDVDATVSSPPREGIDPPTPPTPPPPQAPAPPTNESPPNEVDPLDSWVAQMKIFAGESAQSCGNPSGGQTTFDVLNACVGENFQAYMSFYGSYTRAGVDSLLSTGLAYDSQRLFIIGFDTYNVGFVRGGYGISECIEPRFQEGVDYFPPFLCDEYVDVEPRAQ